VLNTLIVNLNPVYEPSFKLSPLSTYLVVNRIDAILTNLRAFCLLPNGKDHDRITRSVSQLSGLVD
jgi:hypothetical protein